MRPSSLRHPLAVLRTIIGLRQKELANLVGCSTSTIQSIELGPERLSLSPELADKIAKMTGVNVGWLLVGDPKTRPIRNDGGDYTKRDYERVRAEMLRTGARTSSGHLYDFGRVFSYFYQAEAILSGCLVGALRNDRVFLLLYRLDEALRQIQSEFPPAVETDNMLQCLEQMRMAQAAADSDASSLKAGEEHIALLRKSIDRLVGGELERLKKQHTGPFYFDTRRGEPEPDDEEDFGEDVRPQPPARGEKKRATNPNKRPKSNPMSTKHRRQA